LQKAGINDRAGEPLSYDFRTQRLFVDAPLGAGEVRLAKEQAHYLLNVMRARAGDPVLLFNGRDGEWLARIASAERKTAVLELIERTRDQTPTSDLRLVFAPLKHARLDYMVQKAVEMGASRLVPVITQHTVAQRVNRDRMRANIIEAAEQCGVLSVPEADAERRLEAWLADRGSDRVLVFCDEEAEIRNPIATLREGPPGPSDVLIGPEGGFAAEEREMLRAATPVIRLSLGPRILRADTAAVAALALVQAVRGDFRGS
jgi:16S rRNA (uracil1498-N3)-methyltransferase